MSHIVEMNLSSNNHRMRDIVLTNLPIAVRINELILPVARKDASVVAVCMQQVCMHVSRCVQCCNLLCAFASATVAATENGDSDHDDKEGGGQCGVAAHHHLLSSPIYILSKGCHRVRSCGPHLYCCPSQAFLAC